MSGVHPAVLLCEVRVVPGGDGGKWWKVVNWGLMGGEEWWRWCVLHCCGFMVGPGAGGGHVQ